METDDMDRRDTRPDLMIINTVEIKTQLSSILETITDIKHALYGNGNPGIIEKVAKHEERNLRMDYWGTLIFRTLFPVMLTLMGFGLLWIAARNEI